MRYKLRLRVAGEKNPLSCVLWVRELSPFLKRGRTVPAMVSRVKVR